MPLKIGKRCRKYAEVGGHKTYLRHYEKPEMVAVLCISDGKAKSSFCSLLPEYVRYTIDAEKL